MFVESFNLIRRIWADENFVHHGKYWTVVKNGPLVQRPHRRSWSARRDPESQVRTRLPAGGNWIRTSGSAPRRLCRRVPLLRHRDNLPCARADFGLVTELIRAAVDVARLSADLGQAGTILDPWSREVETGIAKPASASFCLSCWSSAVARQPSYSLSMYISTRPS
jgi:hypothetical protein